MTKQKSVSKGFNKAGISNTRLNHVKRIVPIRKEDRDGWYIGIDYLRVQLPAICQTEVRYIVKNLFPYELVHEYREVGWSAPGFNDRYSDRYRDGCTNSFVLIRATKESEKEYIDSVYKIGNVNPILVDLWLELPGSYWKSCDLYNDLYKIYYLCNKLNGKCTRIDLKIDMYSEQIKCEEIRDAIEKGNYAKVRKCGEYRTFKLGEDAPITGFTFGSRESDSYYRYYDAKPIHDLDCRRWEAEYKGQKATGVVNKISELCEYRSEVIKNSDYTQNDKNQVSDYIACEVASLCFLGIDFIDRSMVYSNGNLREDIRLPWYQTVLDRIGTVCKISIAYPKCTIERSKKFYERIKKSLAMLLSAMGGEKFRDWFSQQINEGLDSLSPYHIQAINEYKYIKDIYICDDDGTAI